MNNKIYKLAPENYIEREGALCAFKIMTMDFTGQQAFWIMGLTFFHNYYTVFDHQHLRVGFAESKLSSLGNNEVVQQNKSVSNSTLSLALEMATQSSSSVVSTLLIICAVAIALGSLFMMGKLIKKKISKTKAKFAFCWIIASILWVFH